MKKFVHMNHFYRLVSILVKTDEILYAHVSCNVSHYLNLAGASLSDTRFYTRVKSGKF